APELGPGGVFEDVRGIRDQERAADAVDGHDLLDAFDDLVGAHRRVLLTGEGPRGRTVAPAGSQQDDEDDERLAPVHTTPARIRSCRWTIPISRRSRSTTGSAMIPCFSMRKTAAAPRTSGSVSFGFRFITRETGTSKTCSSRSMSRVRS